MRTDWKVYFYIVIYIQEAIWQKSYFFLEGRELILFFFVVLDINLFCLLFLVLWTTWLSGILFLDRFL